MQAASRFAIRQLLLMGEFASAGRREAGGAQGTSCPAINGAKSSKAGEGAGSGHPSTPCSSGAAEQLAERASSAACPRIIAAGANVHSPS